MTDDTIVAVSTAMGEAAISVLRLSGARALMLAQTVLRTRRPLGDLSPRRAYLAEVMDAEGRVMDQGVVIWFRGPNSYSGEDTVEFQGHGGVLVTQRVLERFLAVGARHAEPGEFTQRAFLNGKMDLTQAEAVMDLIHAQSELALRAANEQLAGGIGQQAEALRKPLVDLLAHVEAYIDFPEEDIAPDTGRALIERLGEIGERARLLIETAEQGRILRHGARTVIVGEPNVGKSCFLNALLGYERAIVSATAGTTRDTIEEIIQVDGVPLRLVDTAGIRDSEDGVERSGIERSKKELARADVILEVVDASRAPQQCLRVEIPVATQSRHLLILNKSDLGIHAGWGGLSSGLALSSVTLEGMAEVRQAIRRVALGDGVFSVDHPIAINVRHKSCFERVVTHCKAAETALQQGLEPEFVALDLREALAALGDVIGQTDIEQILDVIFSSFCIGK
jgi:tRNA modification GTPase